MGSVFEEDEEKFDLVAIEARHEEMEAEAALAEYQESEEAKAASGEQLLSADVETAPDKLQENMVEPELYPVSDWEAIVEAVLFTMGNSVELRQLATAIDQSEKIAGQVVERLKNRYEQENRGMQILTLEGAYQMCTKSCFFGNLIRVAASPKKQVLTDVVLETLSIIAYKQPVTKVEIAKIRGVSSDHAVNRLVEYGLVYEAGRLDAPGRPALFATTEEFLRRFGVGSVVDLPTINPEQEEEIKMEVAEELQYRLGEEAAVTDETADSIVEELAEQQAEADAETI